MFLALLLLMPWLLEYHGVCAAVQTSLENSEPGPQIEAKRQSEPTREYFTKIGFLSPETSFNFNVNCKGWRYNCEFVKYE